MGEASSLYLFSQDAAEAIAAAAPAARIVAILREPASFLRSLHLQLLQIHNEDREGPARGHRAGARAAPGRADTRQLLAPAGAALLRARALRRAAAPLYAVFAPEQILTLDLRRLPRRQRRPPCDRCCASSGSTTRSRCRHCRRTPRSPCARCGCDALKHTLRTSGGADARAARAAGEAPTGRRAGGRACSGRSTEHAAGRTSS